MGAGRGPFERTRGGGERRPAVSGAAVPYGRRLGIICAVFGAVAVASFCWTWALSVTDLDPPNWIRIPGILALPLGVVAAVGSAIAGRRSAPRGLLATGLALAAAALVGFLVLIVVLG
jgi:hypothetical protein